MCSGPHSPSLIAEGNVLAVDFLVRNGCSPQQKLQSFAPLHVAAQSGDLELAALLIDRGAHLEAQSAETGSTPLKYAVFFAQIDMVKMLLQKGADVENSGGTSRTPLQLAEDATSPMFRDMGTPGSDLDYARIANILRGKSVRKKL